MARNKIQQRTLYTERRYHQGSNGIGSIYDTSWSTIQNSPIFDTQKYENGVNIGNFQVKFNDNRNNDALLYSNGAWLTPNSGYGCFVRITTDSKGRITNVIPLDSTNKGIQYKIGDRFSVIQLGGIDGLVEITKIGNEGSVEELTIINPGKGYKNATIELNDTYWTIQEIKRIDENNIPDEISNNIQPKEWQLKLDWTFFNNFALYGSLVELIKTSLLNIVNDFPGSLWMVHGLEVSNPFNIDFFTSNNEPYIDDVKIFQQNHNKYEVVDTISFNYINECSGNSYEELYLTECKRDITSIESSYRFVYVKKNNYVGYVSPTSSPDANIKTYPSPYYPQYYTLDNNNLIVSTIGDEEKLTKQERYETSGGRGYITKPTVTITGGNGSGATAEATINNGIVTSIKVINNGSGYTSIPNIVISSPPSGGATAKAIAKISNGKVIHIDVVEKVNIGCVGDAYYKPIKLLDKITIKATAPRNLGNFTYNTCCNCGSNKTYTCNNNPITFEIIFNYDDNNDPCRLINHKINIIGNDTSREGYHIIPKKEFITTFFKNLDDFQRKLLNQNTFPKYSSMFYIPDKDLDGSYNGMYVNKTFRINTLDGWNLDLMGSNYQEMIESLLDSAEYLDNMKCDNIYRMLTHDSIKNLDWSLKRIEDKALAESYIIGETQLKRVLRIYGRMYDEIKKHIHGIEIMNNLTYNQLDNYPDGLLRTEVDTFGWKSITIIDEYNYNIITEPLYYGWRQEYNSSDVESEFFRRLLLNSAHIMSWKGTKHGIEMLMNLFGIERNKWSLNEMVYVAEGSSYGKTDNRTNKNTTMLPDEIIVSNGDIKANYEYNVYGTGSLIYNGKTYYSGQTFWGHTGVTTFTVNGSIQVIFNPIKNIETLNYKVVNTEIGVKVSNDLDNNTESEPMEDMVYSPICFSRYYIGDYIICKTCNGTGINVNKYRCEDCNGLGKSKRYIGVPSFPGNSERLYYQQYGGWYQDTKPEIKFKQNIQQLIDMVNNEQQKEGLIVFVKNDSEWKNILSNAYSNYWILIDENIPHRREGWYNLTIEETKTETTITTKNSGRITINIQSYLQVPSTNEGNNPHTGDIGGYDMGNSYLQHFGYDIVKHDNTSLSLSFNPSRKGVVNSIGLFNTTLEKTPECLWGEPQFYLLEDVGFKLRGHIDNKGCWVVYRNEGYSKRILDGHIEESYVLETGKPPSTKTYIDDRLYIDSSYSIYPKTRNDGCLSCNHIWEENYNHNVRGNNLSSTEFYRIINCKNLLLTYNSSDESDAYFFINTVLPYIEELIPTNSIIELEFGTPIVCGIGVMRILNELNGNQCEEEGRTAINKVAKLRNVPCGTIDNPC